MGVEKLDCKGLKCPQPILKVAIIARKVAAGTKLEVESDCPAFPSDVKKWCQKNQKTLIDCTDKGDGKYVALIQF